MSGAVPAGWEGILDSGERILWQGRPDGGFVLRLEHLPALVFGGVFAGFALFWMVIAAQAGGLFWSFGLIHFSVGLGIALGPPVLWMIRRRGTWYTLTDRRAFIATELPVFGRKLAQYPITRDAPVIADDRIPGSVIFAREARSGRKGRIMAPVGFDRIADAGAVTALIRAIQNGTLPQGQDGPESGDTA